MLKRTAYQCDYCGHILTSKHGMQQHEAKCIRNPQNCTCATCAHDLKEDNECSEGARPGKNFIRNCPSWMGIEQ